ncbi:MAG: hypothetical protein M1530_01090 [Candidatus Marsarchaeota archaeon]|nr:hypothetical protein [Candidatus Marsarchaeota archaeon]
MMEIYDPSITMPSLEELKVFALWYNQKIGNYPVIVGGWAVYFYTKGLGSKDIDVVFAGDAAKHQTLFAYFLSHGFIEKPQGLFETCFVKEITVDGKPVEIIVDATSQGRTIIFEGRKARLPWAWAFKHSQEYRVGESTVLIPEAELLLVYKLGAILGRNDCLKAGQRVEYYRSKIWKDVVDVIGLSALKLDAAKVREFLKLSGLDEFSGDIMQIMEDNFTEETQRALPGASLEGIRKILAGRGDDPIKSTTPRVFKPGHR